ncbi:MAG: J domain-containing protein [Gammaproteobacteria bacterium]|nr:J domain-containing protein [Gammaproteobacteria bacterium]
MSLNLLSTRLGNSFALPLILCWQGTVLLLFPWLLFSVGLKQMEIELTIVTPLLSPLQFYGAAGVVTLIALLFYLRAAETVLSRHDFATLHSLWKRSYWHPQRSRASSHHERARTLRRLPASSLTQSIATRAGNGDADAQFEYAEMLRCGDGISADIDYALEMHRMAARQGHVGSQVALSYILQGKRGAPRIPAEALQWALEGAKRGNCSAQCNAALFYLNGVGAPRDYRRARELFEESIRNGMEDGTPQYYLGQLYASALGVEQDLDTALDYLRSAESRGYNASREIREVSALRQSHSKDAIFSAIRKRKVSPSPPPQQQSQPPPRPQKKRSGPTHFTCPSCEQKLKIDHPSPNGKGRCTACGVRFRLVTDEQGTLSTFIEDLQSFDEYSIKDQRANTLLIKNCFTVLGIAPDSSYTEAKRAYRSLIFANHPDKVDTLSAEVRESAAIKTKQLNHAMKILKEKFYFA